MGRPFNPHAERSRSTEFDSRGAHIFCRHGGAGVPASLSARRSRVRTPLAALSLEIDGR